MTIARIVVAVVLPVALLGCPDKGADAKASPTTSAATTSTAAPTTTASAAPAKSGGAGW